jgi:hypothetical protein
MFAMDVGFAIDLDHAERLIANSEREHLRQRRRSPSHFEYRPAPLRVTQDAEGCEGMIAGRVIRAVEIVLYDFGAASVNYLLPMDDSLTALSELAEALYDHEKLRADAQARLDALVKSIGPAVARPGRRDVHEDYVIYQVEARADAAAAVAAHGRSIAQVLRAERQALSDQQVAEAMAARLSYGTDDVTVVDWNAAIVIDRDADDVMSVLEFANVELMELRQLDEQLDEHLDEAYATISRRPGWFRRRSDMNRLGRLQVESALLFEGVNNALKLLGDQYLARVYRAASDRLHIPEWDTSILRKLQTLESIYQKLEDRQTTWRMEVLEWIIIGLIAFEVVMSFVRE